MNEAEPLTMLQWAGPRSMPQRLAIVREAFTRSHPTVGEVYEAVQDEFPTTGLATVYNTLRTMTDKGLVSELPFANVTRFEVHTRPHANLVCRRCGALEDCDLVDQELPAEIQSRVAGAASLRPETQQIDIYGLCRNCS